MGQRRVRITSIRQTAIDHPRLEPCMVYANLIDYDNGELIISATLEYICHAIASRKLLLVTEGMAPSIPAPAQPDATAGRPAAPPPPPSPLPSWSGQPLTLPKSPTEIPTDPRWGTTFRVQDREPQPTDHSFDGFKCVDCGQIQCCQFLWECPRKSAPKNLGTGAENSGGGL